MLLFAEASTAKANVINAVSDEFCRSSGEKMNRVKTNLFFSSNVPANVARSIGKIFGFTITNNLGRYLGMPLLHTRVTTNT